MHQDQCVQIAREAAVDCGERHAYMPRTNEEAACALTHIEEAMHWLQQRTLERMRRGVEGTHTV